MQHSAAVPLSRPVAGAPSAAPLAGLAGTDLSRRFRHWRGKSGRRHLFSVFPLSRIAWVDARNPASLPRGIEQGCVGEPMQPCFEEPAPGEDAPRFAEAVVMAVGRDAEGAPRILALDETGPLPDLFYDSAPFRAALAEGAHEIHVHLLADGPGGRAAVLRDLDGA